MSCHVSLVMFEKLLSNKKKIPRSLQVFGDFSGFLRKKKFSYDFFPGVCCVGVSRHARVPQTIPISSNRAMKHKKVSKNKIWGQNFFVLTLASLVFDNLGKTAKIRCLKATLHVTPPSVNTKNCSFHSMLWHQTMSPNCNF